MPGTVSPATQSSLPTGVNSLGANESLGRRTSRRITPQRDHSNASETATISGIEAVTGSAAPLLDAEVASDSHLMENTDVTRKAPAAARCMPDRCKSHPHCWAHFLYPLIRVEGYGEV